MAQGSNAMPTHWASTTPLLGNKNLPNKHISVTRKVVKQQSHSSSSLFVMSYLSNTQFMKNVGIQ